MNIFGGITNALQGETLQNASHNMYRKAKGDNIFSYVTSPSRPEKKI